MSASSSRLLPTSGSRFDECDLAQDFNGKDDILRPLRRGMRPDTDFLVLDWDRDAPGKSGGGTCEDLKPSVDAGLGHRPPGGKHDRFNRLQADQKSI